MDSYCLKWPYFRQLLPVCLYLALSDLNNRHHSTATVYTIQFCPAVCAFGAFGSRHFCSGGGCCCCCFAVVSISPAYAQIASGPRTVWESLSPSLSNEGFLSARQLTDRCCQVRGAVQSGPAVSAFWKVERLIGLQSKDYYSHNNLRRWFTQWHTAFVLI